MEIQIGHKISDVELLHKEGNHVQIRIDGEVYDVDAVIQENGTCSLLHRGNSYHAELIKEESSKHYRVNLNYSTYHIDMLDSQAKYMKMRRERVAPDGQQERLLRAPMACKVVSLNVQVGDELKAGDTALTIEAMKMQSNIKVSNDCIVQRIMVSAGDSTQPDQALVEVKPLNEQTQ